MNIRRVSAAGFAFLSCFIWACSALTTPIEGDDLYAYFYLHDYVGPRVMASLGLGAIAIAILLNCVWRDGWKQSVRTPLGVLTALLLVPFALMVGNTIQELLGNI